jgi:C1A family cysteine protease
MAMALALIDVLMLLGSCWAFSATGSLEGAVALKFGKLVSVSEQQLVDCSGSEGNIGCNGGLMDAAFEWWIKNGGACSQADYPYTARDGTCKTVRVVALRFDNCPLAHPLCSVVQTCKNIPETKITGYVDIKEGDEAGLLNAVAITPVSVAIEADQVAFQFYKSGVFTAACGTNLDHGVLAVGYDTTPSQNYCMLTSPLPLFDPDLLCV